MNIPSPIGGMGDEVRSRDGVICREGSQGSSLDIGVAANSGTSGYPGYLGAPQNIGNNNATAYARVTIPLGGARQRVDCNRLYELELQRLRLELEQARQSQGATVVIR